MNLIFCFESETMRISILSIQRQSSVKRTRNLHWSSRKPLWKCIRIAELSRHDREELRAARDQVRQRIEEISRIYGSAHLDMTNAERIYKRLGRDAAVLEDGADIQSFSDGAYGVLVDHSGTSYGYARTYLGLLDACGIEGELISGRKDGKTHYWCLVRLDGEYYYVDPSYSPQDEDARFFLLGSEELLAFGYESYRMASLPEVILPEYLKPVPMTPSE